MIAIERNTSTRRNAGSRGRLSLDGRAELVVRDDNELSSTPDNSNNVDATPNDMEESVDLFASVDTCGAADEDDDDDDGGGNDQKDNSERLAREAFARFDADRSGSIEPHEFRRVLRELGRAVTQRQSDAIFRLIDVDGSGAVEEDEVRLCGNL